MGAEFHAEVRRQIGIAADYAMTVENIQQHLDSWAERHARVRVRMVENDIDDGAETAQLLIEMFVVDSKPAKALKSRRDSLVDWVATLCTVAVFCGFAVIGLGVCVRLARLIGGEG